MWRLLIVCLAFALAPACDDVSHESLDEWMKTKKGPGKLASAANSTSLDPDLVAHAGVNLAKIGREADLRAALDRMGADRRSLVVGKLAPRLWPMARLEQALAVPSGPQSLAKDLLFEIRGMADDATRTAIDGYLVDWYTGGYYEGRAQMGLHAGAKVLRAIGAPASAPLVAAANAVVAKPPRIEGTRQIRDQIGDQLLLGLAAVGTPEAVGYLLDIAAMRERDETLPVRAIGALHRGYVDSQGLIDVVPPAALLPHLDRIARLARDEGLPARVANDATALLRAAGAPACLSPLISLISYPARDLRYVGANSALKCAGASAIVMVGLALPPDRAYQHEDLGGAVWTEAAKAAPADETKAALRELLASDSWVARWVAVEALGAMKSSEDKARIGALGNDRRRLDGYWGDGDLPAKARKAEPTLGDRARAIAAAL